jgi:type VI secretion system ImpM family protein
VWQLSGAAASVGVYGKVSTQGDFLRVGAGAFSQAGLDRWLEEAVGVLATERLSLPAAVTGCLFVPPSGGRAFLGAFAPSADAVGRQFPLVLFAEIDGAAASRAFPVLPASGDGFVRAAGELALGSREASASDLSTRLASLAPLAEAVAPRGDEIATLVNEPLLPLTTALGSSPGALAYALRTFVTAADQGAKAGAGAGPAVTVDAPAPTPACRELWLELARRRFNGRGAPAATLWTDEAGGRLLIAMGPPAPSMFAFLANERHRSQRLWPLRTSVGNAMTQALAALTPEQRRCVEDPHASMGQVVAAFG